MRMLVKNFPGMDECAAAMVIAGIHITFVFPEGEYYSSSPVIWQDLLDPQGIDYVC